jgi:mono/diheme cytochrome c family protein
MDLRRWLVFGLFLVPLPARAADRADYLRDIKPILAEKCYACHGSLKQASQLRLDTAALIRKGGRHGPAIIPGKSSESLLIAKVTEADGETLMPPEGEGERLSAAQIARLKAWIDQGAPAPDEPVPPDPREHWAYRPPVRRPRPPVNGDWAHNPIDAFLASEHARLGLTPVGLADRHVLVRRVFLDLIGLPPTPQELEQALADNSADWYEKLVDRLLASPQHGERWGRHWMDVWRYSDWSG